jgi:hypothetical protein
MGKNRMDGSPLLFWKSGPNATLSQPEIARELLWGEEVDGLIDLPIREIIDRLRAEFPQHDERPGLLVCRTDGGSFEATWAWQHVRVDCRDLSEIDRQRLIDAVESFGCAAWSG